MDRFTYSIFAVLLAVIIAGVIALFIPRHHEVVEVPVPAVAAVEKPISTGTPDPKSLFETPSSNLALVAGTPLPAANGVPLAVSPASMAMAMPTPVPWTPPNHGKVVTVVYPGFTVVYSVTLGNPLAVQYAMVNGAKPKRYPTPVAVKTPKPALIEAAGYARGAMALEPSISLYFGKASGRNALLMTNLCAFNPPCLAGPWAQFATLEKRYAGESGWLEVVAGPIFSSPPAKTANGLIVPDAFFRVYRRAYGDTMAFIIPQTANSPNLATYLTSIASVEAATGVAIFENTVSLEERGHTAEAVW